MKEILSRKLHEYIRENNPDLLVQLEESGTVTPYLSDKISMLDALPDQQGKDQPAYIIEEAGMNILTQDLRPSKFNYISAILEDEFEDDYQRFNDSGILKFELINLIGHCLHVFDEIGFITDNEDDWHLRYTITGAISEYLEMNSENENVSHGLQQPTKITG